MYVVTFCGEYDLDDFGNVIPSRKTFNDYDAAVKAAEKWERDTYCIATIEYVA